MNREPVISQALPFAQGGQTISTTSDRASAVEGGGPAVALGPTATVQDLAKALNLLGATPRDLIAVLEAIKAAGALDADLEVLE